MPKYDELIQTLKNRSNLPQVKIYPLLNPHKFDRAFVIDVHNLAWRSYFAKTWHTFKTSKGKKSGHVFGAFTKIFSIVKHLCINTKIKCCLVLVEDEYPVKQKKLYSDYKANRKERDFNPVPDVIEMLHCFPHILASVPTKDEEADSIIASYISQVKGVDYYVLSTDKDLWQLWKDAKFLDNATTFFTDKDYNNAFNDIPCKMIPLFKSIFGDSSDNIPPLINTNSITGKDAQLEICKTLKTINKPQELFANIKNIPEKYIKKLRANKKRIRTMYKVARLHKKVKISIQENEGNYKKLLDLMLNKWECKSKIKDIEILKNL